ncbi:unnamed protein product [Rhodiola kirilowii]
MSSYYSREPWNDEDDGEDGCEGSKVAFWMMRNIPQFGGAIGEDPVRHEQTFHAICYYIKPEDEPLEKFELNYFKFSLTESASSWFYSSGADYESSYWDLRVRFLEKFSPPSLRFKVREKLRTFEQFLGETFYEYYVHFNDLQGSCPHHGFPDLFLLQRFLEGMMPLERNMLDAAAGGSVMNLRMYELWNLIDDVAERSGPRPGQMHKTDDKAQTVEADSVPDISTVAVVDVDATLKECAYWVNKMLAMNQPGAENEEIKSEAVSIASKEEFTPESLVQTCIPDATTMMTDESGAKNEENDSDSVLTAPVIDISSTLMSEADAPVTSERDAAITSTADEVATDTCSRTDPFPSLSMQEAKHEPEKPTTEHSLTTSQAEPPEKCKNPGALTVTRGVGETLIHHCLIDLGANITAMPYSLSCSLNLGPLKLPKLLVELENTSRIRPVGLLEDLTLHVGDLVVPIDSYVLQIGDARDNDPRSLILGRLFLSTTKTKIDMGTGQKSLVFDGKILNFQIDEDAKRSFMKKRPRHGMFEWKPGWRNTRARLDGPAAMIKVSLPTRKDVKANPPDRWRTEPSTPPYDDFGQIEGIAEAKFDLTRPWDPNL